MNIMIVMNKKIPEFNFVDMPDYFTQVLRSNMQSSSKSFANLKTHISSHKGFLGISQRTFSEFLNTSKQFSLDKVITNLGWLGFRDRLAAVFLDYKLNGHFSNYTNLKSINDLLDWESSMKSCMVEGYGRLFLLGLYLKMGGLSEFENAEFKCFDFFCENLCKNGKVKLIEVDWVLLLLFHFKHVFGETQLKSMIDQSFSLNAIYEQLSDDEKYFTMRNLLKYGASIGDHEIFFSQSI